MNIEDRAQLMLEEIPNQKPWEGKEELKAKFIKHLRDQIEDCAAVCDEELQSVPKNIKTFFGDGYKSGLGIAAEQIRALAGKKEGVKR